MAASWSSWAGWMPWEPWAGAWGVLVTWPCLALAAPLLLLTMGAVLLGHVTPRWGHLLALPVVAVLLDFLLPPTPALSALTLVACLELSALPAPRLAPHGKVVLISGCDSGLGWALARRLDGLGVEVVAGLLDPECRGGQLLHQCCSSRLSTAALDVTNMDQIRDVASSLQLRGCGLWGLVNNAGRCYVGGVEVVAGQDMELLVKVNLLGPLHLTRACLPLLRTSRGRIVNVASITGMVPIPLMSGYCMSKAGLTSLSEVLRQELRPWGIKVSTVVPSAFKTGILAYNQEATAERWWQQASETVRSDYGRHCFYTHHRAANWESKLQPNLESVTEAMVDGLLSRRPRAFYHKGLMSSCLPFLYLHLPTPLSDLALRLLGDWFVSSPNALHRNSQQG